MSRWAYTLLGKGMKNVNMYERIKQLRLQKGLTQEDVSKALGYTTRSTISRIEKGDIELSQPKIEAFANLLGVTPIYLMFGPAADTPETFKKVPLIGNIACGKPIMAEENIIDKIPLPSGVQANFALRCRGSSMCPTINDGDIVYIRQQPVVEDGQIAAVIFANCTDWAEATLKRVYQKGEILQLVADNRDFSPMFIPKEERKNIIIVGKAVAVHHAL